MPDLLERETHRLSLVAQRATKDAGSGIDEAGARDELRRQIGKLEGELAGLVAEGMGRVHVPYRVDATGPPRVLDLGELEEVRDALATRLTEAHRTLAERAFVEKANRELLEDMLATPQNYQWVRISRADVGEPGCGHWHSPPSSARSGC